MARVTLYVPDNLRDRMLDHPNVNWSAVLQRAVQDELKKPDRDWIILDGRRRSILNRETVKP